MDLEEVLQSVPELILQVALQLVMIGFGAIVLAVSDPQIFIIVLALSAVQVITAVAFNRPVVKRFKVLRGANNAIQNHLVSVYSGLAEIYGEEWGKKWCDAYYRAERIVDIRGALLGVMDSMLNVIILTFGGIALINGCTTIGSIMSSYMLVSYITDPVMSLLGLYTVHQNASAAAERLADLDL
jgi:ABC-type bacteriocin/lantibiotic exporter with double-glycine peptidase domain